MEQNILAAAIKDRSAFDELLVASIDDDLSDLGKIVWKEVKEFYSIDPQAECVDRTVFDSSMSRKYEKHAARIKEFLDLAKDVSVANVVREVFEVKLEAVRHKMSQALVASKDNEYIKLREQFDALKRGEMEVEGTASEVAVSKDIRQLIAANGSENKIRLLPSSLERVTEGGVLRGNHIVVYAPTEMGKSLFCLNMAYGFLKQGLKVMYGCNEDPMDVMLLRALYRLSDMTKQEIEKDPEKAEQSF